MSDEATRPAHVGRAHTIMVSHVRTAKVDVQARLEDGDRNWPALREAVEKYIEFQTAADVLSGQTGMVRQ